MRRRAGHQTTERALDGRTARLRYHWHSQPGLPWLFVLRTRRLLPSRLQKVLAEDEGRTPAAGAHLRAEPNASALEASRRRSQPLPGSIAMKKHWKASLATTHAAAHWENRGRNGDEQVHANGGIVKVFHMIHPTAARNSAFRKLPCLFGREKRRG